MGTFGFSSLLKYSMGWEGEAPAEPLKQVWCSVRLGRSLALPFFNRLLGRRLCERMSATDSEVRKTIQSGSHGTLVIVSCAQ